MALAEGLAEAGWRTEFAVGSETIPTVAALAASGFRTHVLVEGSEQEALFEAAQGAADLLVIDHYGRDGAFEQACRPWAHKILILDDATGRDHDCEILVDAAASDPECYAGRVPHHARVLTGPSFALVRQTFSARRAEALSRRDGRPVTRVLISCGATDPANATSLVLDALHEERTNVAIDVALSSRAPHLEAIRARLRAGVRLVLDPEDMAELIARTDIGIGAGGASAYERALLGLPSIVLTLADNQRPVVRMLVAAGAAVDGGGCDDDIAARLHGLMEAFFADNEARVRMARCASRLIDGRGAVRIMLGLLDNATDREGARVLLRLAASEDEEWLLYLQSQPQTRRFFRDPAPPTASEHHRWMQRTLADPTRTLLMIERDGRSVGMVRLDHLPDRKSERRCEISIAVDPDHFGRGIASSALSLVRQLYPGMEFDAVVMSDNLASQALFAAAGFVRIAGDLYRGIPS